MTICASCPSRKSPMKTTTCRPTRVSVVHSTVYVVHSRRSACAYVGRVGIRDGRRATGAIAPPRGEKSRSAPGEAQPDSQGLKGFPRPWSTWFTRRPTWFTREDALCAYVGRVGIRDGRRATGAIAFPRGEKSRAAQYLGFARAGRGEGGFGRSGQGAGGGVRTWFNRRRRWFNRRGKRREQRRRRR